MSAKATPTGLALLREPFPAHQVSTLPKPYSKESAKGNCRECGGHHGLPATHLEYVGHAAMTDRLLDADPSWTWEPVAFDAEGLPRFDKDGGLWIRLTICGVTRLGYGDAQGKRGPNAVKEAIGDGLRNAAMRFGGALDLWHRGDLHAATADGDRPTPTADDPVKAAKRDLWAHAQSVGTTADGLAESYSQWARGELLADADEQSVRDFLAHLTTAGS